MFDNSQVTRPLSEMVRPVSLPGIDTMRIRRGGVVAAEVERNDLTAFSEWSGSRREILSDTEREVYLTIRNVVFDAGLKWRFSDGLNSFAAVITDPDFNARVENREAFAKGDLLRCLLRTTQWRDDQGQLHTDVEVVRVLEHFAPQPQPTPLFPAQ